MRQFGRFGPLVAALDHPSTHVALCVFAANTSEMLTYHRVQIPTYYPKDGWAEQNPQEILQAVYECIDVAIDNLRKLDINPDDIVSLGIANQRETILAWDVRTGRQLYDAICWMDNRSSELIEDFRKKGQKVISELENISGLYLSTYFSAPKICWLFKYSPKVKEALKKGTCKIGTIDSWIIWNLTGGNNGGLHMTDVTNASRTMLMNITTLKWDPKLCKFFNVPKNVLPCIKSSSEIYGYIITGPLTGIPISGCVGIQQAALLGQSCLKYGQAKCTYGTGAFLLCNTGTSIIKSKNGLLTTVAYKFGPDTPAVYALEGSIAFAGSVLNWLADNLELIEKKSPDPETLMDIDPNLMSAQSTPGKKVIKRLCSGEGKECDDNDNDVYFVPAFSGLYAPYWQKDACSIICGLSGVSTKNQLVQSVFRAIGFQTRSLLYAIEQDCGKPIEKLLAGGPSALISALIQTQADICGIPIVRPVMSECSALGAALAAGQASGIDVWPKTMPVSPSDTFYPTTDENEREMMNKRWEMALDRSIGKFIPADRLSQEEQHAKEWRFKTSVSLGIFALTTFLTFMAAASR